MKRNFEKTDADMVSDDLEAVRESSPLVYNVTNYVVMNLTANALLAIGARPVMSDALQEAVQMSSASDALVLNIGTLSERWKDTMMKAGWNAIASGKPVVLDPVGAGLTYYRSEFVKEMFEYFTPYVIKGNPDEITAILSSFPEYSPTPSDCEDSVTDAELLALKTASTVIVTGSTDYITDGHRFGRIFNGSPVMARTTGMGCTAAALAGAFLTVTDDTFRASVSTMAVMGIAGQRAAEHSTGNGSFQVNFLDELYNMNRKTIKESLIWEE